MTIVEDADRTPDPRLIRWGAYGLTVVGALAVLFAALEPSPTSAAVALALPPIPVGLAVIWPQLFQTLSGRWRGFYPVVGVAAVGVSFFAFNTRLIDVTPALMFAGGGAALGLVAAAYAVQKPGVGSRRDWFVPLAVIGGLYGFGAFAEIDSRFDASSGTLAGVLVTGKHESHGKSTTYVLELAPWGPVKSPSTADVSESFYQAITPGSTICATMHPGALKSPWFTLDLCPETDRPSAPANAAAPL